MKKLILISICTIACISYSAYANASEPTLSGGDIASVVGQTNYCSHDNKFFHTLRGLYGTQGEFIIIGPDSNIFRSSRITLAYGQTYNLHKVIMDNIAQETYAACLQMPPYHQLMTLSTPNTLEIVANLKFQNSSMCFGQRDHNGNVTIDNNATSNCSTINSPSRDGKVKVVAYNRVDGVEPGNINSPSMMNRGGGRIIGSFEIQFGQSEDLGTNPGNNGNDTNSGLLSEAKSSCSGISEKMDKIKIAAGISTAASAVGTVAAGAATIAGVSQIRAARAAARAEAEGITIEQALADESENDSEAIAAAESDTNDTTGRNVAGTIQTAGSFVAAGTGVVASVSSFIGAGQFDELISDMNKCSAAIRELETTTRQMAFDSPDSPELAEYNNIVEKCRGLDTNNIENVKKAMIAAGVVSAVGAGAAVVGGVMNVSANKDGNNTGVAPTVLSGAAALTSAGSTIISGVVLSRLNKNSDIANDCTEAFGIRMSR